MACLLRTRSRGAEILRGQDRAVILSSVFKISFSTFDCVAIAAWSVPGIQSVRLPRMRAIADHDVLQGVLKGVADVQHPRHVRRRKDDGERFGVWSR